MSTENSGRPVRVRFAPSPTGDLHVGGVRSALFTWLFAKQHDGVFILRIEDTDRKRYKEESVESITESLRWMDVIWDEGPYFQSDRLPLYERYARRLVDSGRAYECYCSPERLDQVRAQQIANKQPPGYDRFCRDLSPDDRAAAQAEGIRPAIRFKVPLEGETVVHDELRGAIVYENRVLEDAVLLKSDGFPTYHLAATVDDQEMGISHVMRGAEWLPSAPLHVMLYEALGWDVPPFFHMPVILNPDGKGKLSKRHGAAGALSLKAQGYLPEAVRNYLVLLGWSYNDQQEIFSRDELIEKFDIHRVNPSAARYNPDKLLWFNQYYINHIIELDDLTKRCIPWFQEAGLVGEAPEGSAAYTHVREAVALIKDKMKVLSEAPDLTRFFFAAPDPYDAEMLIPKKTEPASILAALRRTRDVVAEIGVDDETKLERRLRSLGDELGLKAGQLFMPIRVAVTGRTVSPGLFETLRVIGRDRSVDRIEDAIAKLEVLEAQAAD